MNFRQPQLLPRHILSRQTRMGLNTRNQFRHNPILSDIPLKSDASTAASAPPPSSGLFARGSDVVAGLPYLPCGEQTFLYSAVYISAITT